MYPNSCNLVSYSNQPFPSSQTVFSIPLWKSVLKSTSNWIVQFVLVLHSINNLWYIMPHTLVESILEFSVLEKKKLERVLMDFFHLYKYSEPTFSVAPNIFPCSPSTREGAWQMVSKLGFDLGTCGLNLSLIPFITTHPSNTTLSTLSPLAGPARLCIC